MLSTCTVVLWSILHTSWSINPSFPPNFKFGAASAAYQIEGGWDADGKGENIWDRNLHEYPDPSANNNVTGDIATDSYRLWREDVKIAADLKLQFYRFSISWPRILPTGFTNKVNEAGAKYYSDLIDGLLAKGIEPIITLYHWDLPVKIQDLGGWTNPLIVKWFGEYARVIYSLYADRVNTWVTINEPNVVCDMFYTSGSFVPRIKEPDFAPYLCNRHMMLAHAKAYRIFDQEFRPMYTGRLSIALNALWIEPLNPKDKELTELGRQFLVLFGRYFYPIFSKEGGWPPSIEKLMSEVSLRQGYKESRLPPFTDEEKAFIKGTGDFLGINYYTTYMIREARPEEEPGAWFLTGSPELNAILEYPKNAHYGASAMLPVAPYGIRRLLAWQKQEYGDIDVFIMENGFSSTGQLDDYDRIDFIKDHLGQVLLAIKVDNVSVIGYTVWSLTDNVEWIAGRMSKFGLYEVNFSDPNRARTPRASAHYYTCVIENRTLDVPETCLNYMKQNGGHMLGNSRLFINVICIVLVFIFSKT